MQGAQPSVEARPERDLALPVAATAFRLLEAVDGRGPPAIYLARSERRASLLARVLAGLAPDLPVLTFPAWDCVPYDRASPSRDVMGRRIRTLRRLAEGLNGAFVVVTTPEALAQRVPPRGLWSGSKLRLRGRRRACALPVAHRLYTGRARR